MGASKLVPEIGGDSFRSFRYSRLTQIVQMDTVHSEIIPETWFSALAVLISTIVNFAVVESELQQREANFTCIGKKVLI